MIEDISTNELKQNKKLLNSFINASFLKPEVNCNILNSNFYLDTHNYFPIIEENNTFKNLFSRGENYSTKHFYTKEFFENFKKNYDNFKVMSNIFLLGSSATNNYFSNIIHFLPRLYFNNQNNIKIGIHRNSSYKLRKLITQINKKKKINFSFTYLDDEFYKFTLSMFPQFLNTQKSIEILKFFLKPKNIKKQDLKIYITRENADYRKIINEYDLVKMLKNDGYEIINTNLYEIKDQIKIFSRAKKIISAYGSGLTNIVFSQPDTDITVITPNLDKPYEEHLKNRYKMLAEYNKLNYIEVFADTIEIENHSKNARNYINNKILNESNNFKNLIVNLKDFKKYL